MYYEKLYYEKLFKLDKFPYSISLSNTNWTLLFIMLLINYKSSFTQDHK